MNHPVRAVIFDVGETLMDDTRYWASWARWVGVPPHTLAVLVGLVTADGSDNAGALQLIRPGFDVVAERAAREGTSLREQITEEDLYPDVREALTALRKMGFWVGIAGNQTDTAAGLLRGLELPADAIATSGEWGVAKPDQRFFRQLSEWSGFPPEKIAYVGDHRDNDIISARAAGIRPAHIRRGPWGYLHAADPDLRAAAEWCIDSLAELPARLGHAASS